MAQMNLRGWLVLVVICQLFLVCFTHPLQAEEQLPKSTQAEQAAVDEAEATGVRGTATYYAKRYNGRKTFTGVRYDPQKLTAAHATLPMGTRVKVINLANSREVVVTINDRCRKRKRAHIDLSRAAAEQLGFFGKGLTKVEIVTLDEEST